MALKNPFKDLREGISSALVDMTRTVGHITNEDLAFHRSSSPSIVPLLEQQNSRLLRLAGRLAKTATSGTEVTPPQLLNTDSVDDSWNKIVDVFDNILEKADACLDEYTGIIRKEVNLAEQGYISKAKSPLGKQRPGKAYRTQNIPKPQLLFDRVPTNDLTTPFKPLLRSKPNSIVSLDQSLQPVAAEDGSNRYGHPYATEIQSSSSPPAIWQRLDPIPFLPYESSRATLVDTPEALVSMLQELKSTKEIAVDLEHHDEHSYIGLVSLMQISTRDKDWVVDTLKPWREELQILNEVFTDPSILKVFHGASMDIIWLQRDFGLYVVGLFDTYHASRSLGYPKHSLAYLLKRFANFDAAKQYQMADWRIRPLPEEMFNYARSDTHFLLYIYDNLRNELIDQSSSSVEQVDLVRTVMDRSKEETLQRYERPFYDNQSGTGPTGWYHLLCRTPALFNREQFAVFRAVHQWRDEIARQEDESVHFIMPKHVLYNLAREIPVDMPSLLGCSHPMSKSFLKRKEDLLGVIRNAKRNGATGPDMKGFMQTVETTHADGGTKTRRLEHSATASTDGMKETMPSLRRDRTRMPTQANQSRFWGSTIPNNTSVSEARVSVYYENLRLSLPMPPLTAEVFEGAIVVEAVASVPCQTNLGTPAGHLNVKDRQPTRDSVFIVKQDGRSQKRKAADLSDLSDPPEHVSPRPDCNTGGDDVLEDFDGVELLQDSEQWTRTYNEQKQDTNPARRRSKKERAIQKTRTADSQIYKEEKPFDYINAASVLHALNNVPKRTTGMSKSVDPYSKSMDAPKSMPRSRKEIAGKSFTFKG